MVDTFLKVNILAGVNAVFVLMEGAPTVGS